MKYYPVLKRNVYFLDLFVGKGCNGESALLVAVITSLEYLPNNFSLLVLKTVCVCVCVYGLSVILGYRLWGKSVEIRLSLCSITHYLTETVCFLLE